MKLPSMVRMGRLKLFLSLHRYRPAHGPQTWEWWRLFSLAAPKVRVSGVASPLRLNHMLWLYTRWGAWCWQVVYDTRKFDGRKLVTDAEQALAVMHMIKWLLVFILIMLAFFTGLYAGRGPR